MSTKTAKVLHVIAFILIVLTMAFVLVGWLAFKNELMTLVQSTEEYMQAEFTPWMLIIEVGFVLLLALIWLIVLLNRPGRGGTIAMTIIMSILLIGFYAVGKPFLNVWLQQKAAESGVYSLAALSQFNYAAGTIANFAFIPGLFLMVLSLGSACGKNFKKQAEEQPAVQPEQEQPAYEQRTGAQQYGQQPGMQRPQYGQQGARQPQYQQPNYQQGYGQRPQMQNTGYIPKLDAMQNTGYIPKVDAAQNTGYIPKVDAMQNTGYIPKVDAPQNTGYIPKVEPVQQSMGTLPPVDAQAHKTGAIPPVSFSKPTQTPSSPIIYPWMKAAGAPREEAPAAEVQSVSDAAEKLDDVMEDVLPEEVPSAELLEEAAELPEETLDQKF
ncbi:MAG: hypothetical protein J5865_01170 [Lachnospiraceae bacterium]|nr:hypothetical protein [Lachnospiraceae bacterium]